MTLVSRAEFARRAGVSPAAVTKACKKGLADARVEDRIDVEHPAAVAYLQKNRGRSSPAQESRREGANGSPAEHSGDQRATNGSNAAAGSALATSIVHDETDLEQYPDMSLRELVRRFGSDRQYKDWVEALKKTEDLLEKRLNNLMLQKKVVFREKVATHVFGSIEATRQRLLNDIPRTLVARMYAAARSDVPEAEAQEIISDIISQELQALDDQIVDSIGK